ncbi:hypothetical protein MMC10_006941 [Thelotrema lepadinum]|nr:hypothetical protein [Thelotrema lepadinum]
MGPKPFFHTSSLSAILCSLLLLSPTVSAFYLPGVAPTSYSDGELVPLHVNKLTPLQSDDDQQLRSAVPYDYYHRLFHFCQPDEAKGGVQDVGPESLGAVIFGDRIKTSPFELKMRQNETCKRLCNEQEINARGTKFLNNRIRQNYAYNWLIDGFPAGQLYKNSNGQTFRSRGFPLGISEPGGTQTPVLYNHYDIVIEYHDIGKGKYRVVGVLVQPVSDKDAKNIDDQKATCSENPSEDKTKELRLNDAGDNRVTWTYSVYWRPSSVAWAVRWDTYLHVEDPKIHWFSLVNSTVIVFFLVGTVSAILTRALRKDFARYNRLDTFNLDDFSTADNPDEAVQEDSGWKLVHGDVFRPPQSTLLMSVFLGNGAQLFFMTGITIGFALFGFLSPSNRGSLGTAVLVLYTFLGFIGGYVSARTYKTFGGEAWKRNIVLTPVFVPGIVFGTFFLLNFFLWVRGSSGAVPFTTMLVLVGLWFLITLPLSVAGSWIGFRQPPFSSPVRTNQIPRQIPPTHNYLKPLASMLWVGALPFGAIFVELFFIMNSIWFDRIYYMFGFLFICYGILTVTCAAVTIMFVYYLLCSENYRWQWRAFNSAGAGAGFVFMFSLLYWIWKLRFAGFTSIVLYLGYSGLISFLFYIMTGTIGFFSSWAFVHRIYRSIRID